MDIMEAISARHSVRRYTSESIGETERQELEAAIEECNVEGGLHIRLVSNEPRAFDSTLAHYGKFSGVGNYLVLAGPDAPDLEERCGYYGERLVLLAQQLGLNTCWVALTFKKRFVKKTIAHGNTLVIVIALGHGETQGSSRRSKSALEVSEVPAGMETPAWFIAGVNAALLAPTAVNQQKFMISLTGRTDQDGRPLVFIRNKGGAYSKVDLGIVRLHFELGAASVGGDFSWEDA